VIEEKVVAEPIQSKKRGIPVAVCSAKKRTEAIWLIREEEAENRSLVLAEPRRQPRQLVNGQRVKMKEP